MITAGSMTIMARSLITFIRRAFCLKCLRDGKLLESYKHYSGMFGKSIKDRFHLKRLFSEEQRADRQSV